MGGSIDDAARLPDPGALLAESAWLRHLARVLVGEDDADDLSQEVLVAALERKPEPRDGLRPWLTRVARRLALQGRRRAARRDRRELAVARAEEQPSAADVVERVQLHRAVVDAVLSLDEPYRATLLLRFFDDLTPPEVARRCGVPLETARTRLRRGLVMLRARLDRSWGSRDAWVAPIAALAREPMAAGVTATALLGGLVMTMNAKLWFGAAAVAAALLLWKALPEPATGIASEGPASAPTATLQAREGALQRAVTTTAEPGAPMRTPMTGSSVAVLHGRCVAAESGAPLSGCKLELFTGPVGSSARSSGTPRPDATATTGADGLFRVELMLAEPRHLLAKWTSGGRGEEQRSWPRVDFGDLDCGDVTLSLGAKLAGRAVDERGASVGGVLLALTLAPEDVPRNAGSVRSLVFASSGGDGVLRSDRVLVPGHWSVAVTSEHGLVAPHELRVAPGATAVTDDVVVCAPQDLPAISGVAVDADGKPVGELEIHAEAFLVNGGWNGALTGSDGAFTLRRKIGQDAATKLRVFGAQRLAEPDRRYVWGTRDVRLVVLGAVSARLVVADAAGTPVERYALRCEAIRGDQTLRLTPERVRARVRDGALPLRELPPDRYRVVVQAEDSGRGCAAPVEWDLREGSELRVTLREPAILRVALRSADGRKFAGSRVQLLRGERGQAPRVDSSPVSLAETFTREAAVVIVDQGTTDPEGIVALRGPATGATDAPPLAVRALGPGHAAALQPLLALEPGEHELLLRVAAGASVSGRLGPSEALAELWPREADLAAAAGPSGDRAVLRASRAPALRLVEKGGALRHVPVDAWPGVPPRADGTFVFAGVPAGDWELTLECWNDIARGGGTARTIALAEVPGLRDGETRRLDLDVSAARPARIDGTVLREGVPWRRGRVRLYPLELRTDDDGRFSVELGAGRYWLELLPEGSVPLSRDGMLIADEPVDVAAGTRIAHMFEAHRRVLRLRLLEPDGSVAERRLIVLRGAVQLDDARPDAEGWVMLDPAPPQPILVKTYPKGFDSAARVAADLETRKRLVIDVGTITIPVGQREAREELRIPAGR